jgi:hypothetical protein
MIITESRKAFVANLSRILAIVAVVVVSSPLSEARITQKPDPKVVPTDQQSNPITPADRDTPQGDSPASIEEDMRAKQAIKAVEKQYQQNVDRARDLSLLGASVNTSFKQKTYLAKDDLKKLEKAEKLARAIRNAAGGSDDNEMEQPPKDLACALSMFAEVSESLKKNVEKTPKHVVSRTVIDEANVILELTRIVRAMVPNL